MSAGVQSLLPYGRFHKLKDVRPRELFVVASLPQPYQKFYREWRGMDHAATPVHWRPKKEGWVRDPETGELKLIQNVPIPVTYPDQMHEGLWGGEGIVDGKLKKAKFRSPIFRMWIPNFHKTVVFSEILDKYLSVIVTERALQFIDSHNGLDAYLLKTPAYDLKSLLALKLKRKLFFTLMDKDFSKGDLNKQSRLYHEFEQYLIPREEAEWYGYSVMEAKLKHDMILKYNSKPSPLKWDIRQQYLQEMRAPKSETELTQTEAGKSSWMKKLNPFSKPKDAP